MKKGAAVYGAGGHARVIASILRACKIPLLGFFDDAFCGKEEYIQGSTVIGRFEDMLNAKSQIEAAYLAIGDNAARQRAFFLLKENGFSTPSLIHPTTCIEDNAAVGEGTVICLGAIIATEVQIGTGCIINTGVSVDHESKISDFVHLAPKTTIAGRVVIGSLTFVGIGAAVAQNLKIGERAMIGANSVILKDVPPDKKVVGVFH